MASIPLRVRPLVRLPDGSQAFAQKTNPAATGYYATTTASTSNLNIIVSGGRTAGWSVIRGAPATMTNFSFTLGGFFGLAPADISETTLKSVIIANNIKPKDKTAIKQIEPAYMYGGSLILARNNFGLVFAMGVDHTFGDSGVDWIYQDKLWYGIGISSSLGIF